ncbi:MAG: TonB family protein [Syntrophaceae bacterium]
MNAQRLGIVTSLAIHAGFLVLLLSLPIANAIPYMKTLTISFTQEEASQSAVQKETKTIARPQVEEVRNIIKQEIAEKKHQQDEVIINEKAVSSVVKKVEFQRPAKTEHARLGKAEPRTIAETIFGNSGSPSFIHREMPAYPFLARRFGKEGTVVLKLLIDKNGYLQDIEVIEPSGFGFTEAAVDAIKKSTFTPAHRNGGKIASRALLSVHFNLK